MDTIAIRLTFDYVDPGSYLAYEFLLEWRRDLDVPISLEWSPLELRTPGGPPISPEEPGWAAMTDAMRAEARATAIPFQVPKRVPLTRKAHELALHADEKGCFDPVHRALFVAHFVEGRDIGRVDALVAIGEAHGLEPAETGTVLGVDRFLPALETLRVEALERGVKGVPTLDSGGRRFEGLESRAAVEEFLRSVRDASASPESDQNR